MTKRKRKGNHRARRPTPQAAPDVPADRPDTDRTPHSRQTARLLVHGVIFVLALLIRIYFISHVEWFARSDTRDFHSYALNLLRGEGFVVYWNENPVREGFVSRQVHSVGYPLFLAGLYAVTGFDREEYAESHMANMRVGAHPLPAQGFNPMHALAANVALDMITMLALVAMAYRLFDFKAAVLVQLMFALYVSWTPQLISETLFICLFTSALAVLVLDPEFEKPWMTLAFAMLAVLSVMTKPIGIVLYAFVGLWVLRKISWPRIVRAAGIGIPLVLFVAVMFWRSYHYYGHVFVSSTGSQHVVTNNYGYDWTAEHARLREQLGRVPTEYEVMVHFRQLKRQADREDPLRSFRIYWGAFAQMFTWEPDWHMEWLWQANYHRHPEVAASHRKLFGLSLFWYPLGVLGFIVYARRAWIPGGAVLLFLLVHAAVSPGYYRYMAPVNVLFILSSAAILSAAGKGMANMLKENGDDNNPREPASSPASSTAR